MKKLSALLLLFITTLGFAQTAELSDEAEIRVVTVGPYQAELYSAFGHSGIRVRDPKLHYDAFYNYGVFDFDQPNFYLNFARGYLNYRLAVMDYRRVRQYYTYQDRYIHEQILNLTQEQKQELFEFLEWNAKPENMHYYYDYFYDNCATRIRDAVKTTFGDSVKFDGSYIDTEYTIRDLTDLYLKEQPWGDLGIDICLGLPMDKKATPEMYMFLPDYIESAFNHATIMVDGKEEPLVARTAYVNKVKYVQNFNTLPSPSVVFWFLGTIFIFTTAVGYRKRRHRYWLDIVLFTVVGLVGWLLLLLWVATDHKAAAMNFNLLWALPVYFPTAFFLAKKEIPKWVFVVFRWTYYTTIVLLVLWLFLPQDLNEALLPVVVILGLRSWYIQKDIRTGIRI